MKINSLEQMETIVENNKSLLWDGWNVKEITPSPTGWMKPSGVFRKGSWFVQRYYNLKYDGWDIPNKFVGNDAK
jgi:hypothetical protein